MLGWCKRCLLDSRRYLQNSISQAQIFAVSACTEKHFTLQCMSGLCVDSDILPCEGKVMPQ